MFILFFMLIYRIRQIKLLCTTWPINLT